LEATEAERRLKDYILNGIGTEIFFADEAYALAQEIGEHANAIRANGFDSLFASLQVTLSDRQTLSVTKMFDRPSRYPTRSIPATLDFLKTHASAWAVPQRHAVHRVLIDAGAEKRIVERLTNVELTHAVVNHYEGELSDLFPSLTELRRSRDKIIAHNEGIERHTLKPPTWGDALSLVRYAKGFVAVVAFGYLSTDLGGGGSDYYLSDHARRTSKQLRRLLEAANVLR
jgi:AbiU2